MKYTYLSFVFSFQKQVEMSDLAQQFLKYLLESTEHHSLIFDLPFQLVLFIMRKSIKKAQQTGSHYFIIGSYKFSYSDLIGAGNESKVYRGYRIADNFEVAVKVIIRKEIDDNLSQSLLKNSLNCLETLKGSKNILQLYDVLYTEAQIFIVTELCKGDLSSEIRTGIKEDKKWDYVQQILEGFNQLYSAGIVHRDIKPDNIFLNDKGQIKIGDFGFAAPLYDVKKQIYFNIGSPQYMAPETLLRNEYSHQSDIWAIGITFYEMLVGQTPWISDQDEDIKKGMNKKYMKEKIQSVSIDKKAKLFLQNALCIEKKNRIKPYYFIRFFSNEGQLVKEEDASTNWTNSITNTKEQNNSSSSKSPQMLFKSCNLKIRTFYEQSNEKNKKDRCLHGITSNTPKTVLSNLLSPTKLHKKNQIRKRIDYDFPKSNKSAVDPTGSTQKKPHDLQKILEYYRDLAKLIYEFLNRLREQLLVAGSCIKKQCSEQIQLMKICLMNVLIKSLEKVAYAKESKILLFHASIMESMTFLSNKQYQLVSSECLQMIEVYKQHPYLSAYWPKAKEQKLLGAVNATGSFLKKMQTILSSKYKKRSNIDITESCIQVLWKMIRLHQQQFSQKNVQELNKAQNRFEEEGEQNNEFETEIQRVLLKIKQMN